MIVFPNCKINLGLKVVHKRDDGYHDIETIFYPIALTDALEIIENRQVKSPHFPFTISGIDIKGHSTSNLCVKAYKLLKKDFPELPSMQIHLHKAIPAGAGLGGGSADGAFALCLINKIMKLGLSEQQLISYAAMLGSDCPFFIFNKPCFAKGRGEIMEKTDLDLSGYRFVIINPGIHIDTGRAFLGVTPSQPDKSLKEITAGPIERWKDELKNDFEVPIFKQHWEIVEIKDELYRKGAIYASMTGSGSTVYAIFKKEVLPAFSFPEHYFVKLI